jgi:hypothetical protein
MELRIAGKALLWSRNIRIQDQRLREGAASLVAFAQGLSQIVGSSQLHLGAFMPWVNVGDILRAKPPTKKEIEQVLDYRRRKAKARFYADENFPTRPLAMLRAVGCDVTTTQDSKRRGHPDESHAAYALKHGLILITCDRDYLNERRFPLVHCPAIVVFDFGSGSAAETVGSFECLARILGTPQFFDKWVKIDAKPNSWTEYSRFLNGTTARCRYRVHKGVIQEWVDPINLR